MNGDILLANGQWLCTFPIPPHWRAVLGPHFTFSRCLHICSAYGMPGQASAPGAYIYGPENGAATQQHYAQHFANLASEIELKYAFMARHGGAASWLFLPYISCGQVIPRHRLHGLEQKIIGLYPNSLNRMRHSGSLYKGVPMGEQASVCVGAAESV